MHLEKKQIVHVNKNKPKIMINLEEKCIDITERELMYYKQGEDEDILRAIFGIKKHNVSGFVKSSNYESLGKQNDENMIMRNLSYDHSVVAPDDFFNNLFKMNSMNSNVFMK